MGLDNPLHIAFLLIILLLVFGAKRLPELGRSLGHGMRGFKDAIGGESQPHGLAPAQPLQETAQPPAVQPQQQTEQAIAAQPLQQTGQPTPAGERAAA